MHDACITFASSFGVLEKGLFAELQAFFEKNKKGFDDKKVLPRNQFSHNEPAALQIWL